MGLKEIVNVKTKVIVHLNHKSITTSLNHWEIQTERGMVNDCMPDTIMVKLFIDNLYTGYLQTTKWNLRIFKI